MRWTICLALSLSAAHAAPIHLAQQGRLSDATGQPINGEHDLTVSLCPNAEVTPGESCRDELFTGLSFEDGYFSLLLGSNSTLDHHVFDTEPLFVGFAIGGQSLGARQPVTNLVPRHGGMLLLGDAPSDACDDTTYEGALIYNEGQVRVCTANGWATLAQMEVIALNNGYRSWSDGSFGTSCEDYIRPSGGNRQYVGSVGNGVYRIDPDGSGAIEPYDAWCDMSTDDGGWTLVLNLDTSDGHVMWWGNPLWTNTTTRGSASTPFAADHKSPAYSNLSGTTQVRIDVHQQGTRVGYRTWQKDGTAALRDYLAGGDNTRLGQSVIASDIGGIAGSEYLVRTSGNTLYANHCINGTCVTDSAGSPDGRRIGTPQSAPANNNGGGLGDWSDMGYCCHAGS